MARKPKETDQAKAVRLQRENNALQEENTRLLRRVQVLEKSLWMKKQEAKKQ
jgi:hypothetical protein